MYLFFAILGVIGLLGVSYILFGKIQSLTLIDTEQIKPKSKKIKEALMASRLKRILKEKGQKPKDLLKGTSGKLKSYFEKTIDKLLEIEEKTSKKIVQIKEDVKTEAKDSVKEKKLSPKEEKISALLEEVEALKSTEDFKKIESKYIEIIKIDAKNIKAYEGLGHLYLENNQNKEARQIFDFLLKLGVENAGLYINIANLSWEEDNLDEAKTYYLKALSLDGSLVSARVNLGLIFDQLSDKDSAAAQFRAALELEPRNPRYLDLLTEASIRIGDKELAKNALKKLELANPENKKIKDFKKKIVKM